MNRERIQILRDHLAQLPDERFNMRLWFSDGSGEPAPEILREAIFNPRSCGTAACIAGHALRLFRSRVNGTDNSIFEAARNVLKLNSPMALELFQPDGFSEKGVFTRAQAVATLDHLLETGEVEWQS